MLKDTEWMQDIKEKYYSGISNFFIINGNIHDYPVAGLTFDEYLKEQLSSMGISTINQYSHTDNSHNLEGWLPILERAEDTAVIIPYAEYLYSSEATHNQQHGPLVNLHKTVNSPIFTNSNNILILVTESSFLLDSKLLSATSRGTIIDISYPNYEIRKDYVQFLKETSNKEIKSEISLNMFAEITAGLTLVSIEDIYLQAEAQGVMKRSFIMERKTELIKKEYGDVLEVLDAEKYSFDDYAGQEKLKKYHKEVIIEPMINGQLDIVPKGLIYTGPPGTGKTHFAKCLAGEAGISFVELSMSSLQDKWVGESEKNFDRALTCIKSIAPVGVFIDEIDQAFTRGENENNPVNKNLFSMFLTILSNPEYRGKILWVGATNYVNKLDEALKRTGRFDKKMPFLPPSQKDREAVFQIYLNKSKLKNNIGKDEISKLAEITDGYTQAEIEGVVVKAWEVAIRGKSDTISYDNLIYAIECIVTAKSQVIDEMIDIAIDECNDMEFMPEGYERYKQKVRQASL